MNPPREPASTRVRALDVSEDGARWLASVFGGPASDTLGRAFLTVGRMKAGRCWAIVPAATTPARARDFRSGGLPFTAPERAVSSFPSMHEPVCRILSRTLSAFTTGILVLEDQLVPADRADEWPLARGGTWVFGKDVYRYLPSPATPDEVGTAVRFSEANSLIGFISVPKAPPDGLLVRRSTVSRSDPEALAGSAVVAFQKAYDGEGYLLWMDPASLPGGPLD